MLIKNLEPIYFVDGCVINNEYIYMTAKLKSIDSNKYDFSRMFYLHKDKWFHHDLNSDISSVCSTIKNSKELRMYCALSVQGEVEFQYLGGKHIEIISDAGTYNGIGAVKQIKEIAGHLYVCGDQGQVYKRLGFNQWVHFDDGILDRKISASATDLNSIDGIDGNNIYTVGFNGEIFFFSGKTWEKLDSPTNAHLEKIKCISKDEVYICGNHGVLLKGNKNGFNDISDTSINENFWSLESYKNKVYLASLDGLYIFEKGNISPLKTGLIPEIKGYRLHANDGILWSFGIDDLAYFDGKKWTRIIHPDNI